MQLDFGSASPGQRAALDAASRVAESTGVRVWLVGGSVRDLLLARKVLDLDLVVERDAHGFAGRLSERLDGRVRGHQTFGTAKVVLDGLDIDVATARAETYPEPGALPVVSPGSLEDDLRRRDFSVNAIAADLESGGLVDPTGGVEDLRRRRIRILHERSFLDDPTRIFRALRLAARLGFELEEETARRLGEAVDGGALATVSRERLWRELRLAIAEDAAEAALGELAARGALVPLFGELRPPEARRRCLALAARLAADPSLDREALFVAALIRDGERLAGSGYPTERIRRIRALAAHGEVRRRILDESSLERKMTVLDDASPELLALLALEPAVAPAVEAQVRCRRISLAFGARDLDAGEGPHLGLALREVRRALALGRVGYDDALAFARRRALEYLRRGGGSA